MDDEDQRSEYSEDFEDEVAQHNESSAHETTGRDQTKTQSYTYQRKGTERSGDRGSKGKIAVKKRMSSNLRLSPYKHSTSLTGSSPKDRVISARVHEISNLQNELAEKKTAMESLRKENKILLRLQARQEKELSKLQHQEGELPQILAHHAEEVRVLREQLRRSQEAAHAAEKKLAEVREELYRMSGRTKELEEAAKKKDLLERVSLTLQLQQANDTISSKDRKIVELERNCEVLTRNHAQEVRALLSKNRSLTKEAEELNENIQIAQHRLKEKEKELDVLNIYSQRINCSMPKGLSTCLHMPLMEGSDTQTELSFPPSDPVSFHATVTFMTATTQTETPASFFQPLSPPAPPESSWKLSASPPSDVIVPLKSSGADKAPNVIGSLGELHKESLSNVTPQAGTGARAVNSFDGSHVENVSNKLVGEKNAITSNGNSVYSNPSEEEERQKKELLLAKLRALSNGPPASVPLSISALTRNAAEPAVPIGGSIQQGIRSAPTSDNQVMSSAPNAGIAPTLRMDTKQPPPVPHMAAEPGKDASDTSSKLNKSAGNDSSLDSKQLLLAKLMASDKVVPAERSKETSGESNGGSKPAKPLASEARTDPAASKQLLLAKLMAIDTGKEMESSKRGSVSGIPDTLKSEQQPDTNGPSSQSKLENMHRGKPAFATDDDPFGFRVISAEKKKQKESKQGGTGGTFMTENESELPSQSKPRFGRRVQVPLQGGNSSTSTVEQSMLSSAQVPSQSYQPSFMGLLKDTTAHDLGGPQTHALGGLNLGSQVGSISLEGDKDSKELKKASMHTTAATTPSHNGAGNQRPAKPLLPLRPKATDFDIMPGAIQGDDDVEEITL